MFQPPYGYYDAKQPYDTHYREDYENLFITQHIAANSGMMISKSLSRYMSPVMKLSLAQNGSNPMQLKKIDGYRSINLSMDRLHKPISLRSLRNTQKSNIPKPLSNASIGPDSSFWANYHDT